ncbi:hypothetical protein AVEN_145201-1 [Araneus ventricosus]|uniref:Uncharacterized protein n=1 Tax=Araneus ventricosus TaxID=182803 RepID=A0A4Y2Q6M2_ARAVE|nr:hypothetical protein AVEN_145201-1 [Araneus ventricosus]
MLPRACFLPKLTIQFDLVYTFRDDHSEDCAVSKTFIPTLAKLFVKMRRGQVADMLQQNYTEVSIKSRKQVNLSVHFRLLTVTLLFFNTFSPRSPQRLLSKGSKSVVAASFK